jgi:hypothetical protein
MLIGYPHPISVVVTFRFYSGAAPFADVEDFASVIARVCIDIEARWG